jgi:hypothetical protein
VAEHPERQSDEEQLKRERAESTDLGYRDSEEERAYENAQDNADDKDSDADE